MPEINWPEARRYLGYLKEQPDEAVERLLAACGKELMDAAVPKAVWKRFPIVRLQDCLQLAGMEIESAKLLKHLSDCREAYLFGATLGLEADRLIKRASVTDMSRAVMLQACAASLLEDWCDECCDEIYSTLRNEGLSLRSRFSPGYGDFSVKHQRELLAALEAPKKIGLTVTEELMLNPVKSVTAIVGIMAGKRSCPDSREPGVGACAACEKTDCEFRRIGTL